MIDIDSYRRNAADCVRQAQDEEAPEDRNLLLNVALAWLRLAQQTETMDAEAMEAQAIDAQAMDTQAIDAPEFADLADGASVRPERHEMAS